jgi:hypothetical protein
MISLVLFFRKPGVTLKYNVGLVFHAKIDDLYMWVAKYKCKWVKILVTYKNYFRSSWV